ncbi:MAG: replicative DNA helicase, partial [Acidobacteriota bacterium]|nr:replicative DNA helicase [Acidobacteriota bacterium]
MLLDSPLPHSAEDERAVLGLVMLDNRVLAEVAASLTPDDFYLRAHRLVFAAMLEIGDGLIDPLTVAEVLRRRDLLEAAGGHSALAALTHGLPRFASAERFVKVMREKSALRALFHLGHELVTRAAEGDADPRSLLGWAGEAVDRLGEAHARSAGAFRHFDDVGEDAAQLYARMLRNDQLSVPTGFAELDEQLTGGGFGMTNLVIVAGRASHGKTAFALDVAMNAARNGFPAAVASLEMEDTSLFMRAHSAESGVERWKMRSGIYKSDFDRLVQTMARVRELPVYVADHVTSV